MNLSTTFIGRPVATSLLALSVVLGGMVAFFLLPVSPLPQIDSPTITVQASFPGASPETMASTVATPLERTLGHIAGIKEMSSASVTGSTRITMQFELSRNIDSAASDVQAAINAARSLLPPNLPRNPTYHKVNPADSPIMILALTSESMKQGELYDAASTILVQQISQLEGIGQVIVGGSSLPAVRVELNPSALTKYGIGIEDVRAAIEASNPNRPKGIIENDTNQWQIDVNDRASKARDYLSLIIAQNHGTPVRLSDVGDVTDSVEDIRNAGSSNSKPSVLLVLFKQPGANILKTVEQVNALLPQLRGSIPPAIDLSVMMDRTVTIRASLREAGHTLIIAILLVVLVVFLFLRHGRATLIPAIAVPLSLIGTFAIMYCFGYSIDNLSLMALIVATGFVVDDAIVVLENTMRHIEREHMSPVKAALKSVREVGLTVVSMSVSLVAVFIPVLFMDGVVGRLFHEFAVTLSATVLVSLVVSLVITPMMCAYLLTRAPRREESSSGFTRLFGQMHERYRKTLLWALDHSSLVLLMLLCTIALNILLYIIAPKGLFPQQDSGQIHGQIQADQNISFQAMKQKLDRIIDIVHKDPAVKNVVGYTGDSQHDTGSLYIMLKPLDERNISAESIIKRLDKRLAEEPGVKVYLQVTQEVHLGARQSSSQYQYTLQADNLRDLHRWAPLVSRVMGHIPLLGNVAIDQKDKGAQTSLVLDRDTLYALGLNTTLVDGTLYDAYGQRLVSNIYNPLNEYHVIMEVAPQYLQSSSSLKQTYAVAQNNAAAQNRTVVPFSVFSHYKDATSLLSVYHQGQFPSATISFNLKPGVSLSQASDVITQELAKLKLPDSMHGSFQGTARVFEESVKNQPILIMVALLTIYIVLGMLYESYIHPLTILSTLPSAGTGAMLALMLSHTEFTVIAFIGVILLIGIVKKNAIMIIDLALQLERKQGMTPHDAAFEACMMRFRPILMTTLVALLGVLPLALSTGDGAELRQPLGISIAGGLIVSQMLTLYTTPVIYLYFDRLRRWLRQRHSSFDQTSLIGNGV